MPGDRDHEYMPKFSTLIATLMLIGAFVNFWRKGVVWGTSETQIELFKASVLGFLAVLVASGWLYVALRKRVLGLIHAVLMLCVAVLGVGIGMYAFINRWHIMGGTGPDANPVAGIIFLTALAATAVGLIAAICGVGVVWHLWHHKQTPD